jgi:hypothetical protein
LTVYVCPAMVSVPVRAAPVFAVMLNPTDPLPLPLAPDVMLIHEALLVAVHVQPLVVETVTGPPAPAVAATDSLAGVIEYAHEVDVAAAWLTVNVSPAMVSVPVRAAPVFAVTLKLTAPLPLPLAPDVTLIHDALVVVVHAHPLAVETATGPPAPAVAARDSLVGVIENAHAVGSTAAWLTVNVSPPMVSVPVRAAPVFAATLNATDALPVPLAPDVIVIQGEVVSAVHEQVAPVDTVMVPVPPAPPTACAVGAIV